MLKKSDKNIANKLGKVAVLLGGDSYERDISIQSGSAVLAALLRQGVDAHAFDPARQVLNDLKAFERAFIVLHGRFGEDGGIQHELDLMGLPYTGSGVSASKIGMDKWQCKIKWREAGINTPEDELLTAESNFAAIVEKLGLPLFVKPANEGSSIGVSKVNDVADLQMAYELAAKSDPIVIAEKYIDGGEYTVSILGGKVLPIVNIAVKNEFYDYKAKYIQNDTEYLCPCGLSEAQENKIQAEALMAFNVIGCKDWGRVDFLMDSSGQHYFIEVNTVPGMTGHSVLPMAAKAAGIGFDEVVMRVLTNTLDEISIEVVHVA